jgi:hypothetical protein
VLAISPNRSDECHDRNPVKEKLMSDNAIDSENNSKPALDTPKLKGASNARRSQTGDGPRGSNPSDALANFCFKVIKDD